MRLSRRGLIRGFSLGAGYSLLAPFLHCLGSPAYGAAGNSTPKRVVFVLQSNGFHPWEAQPKGLTLGTQRVLDLPLAGRELPAGLAPLKPFQDRVTILQRLSGIHTRPSHSAKFAALGGTSRAFLKPKAETIDAALARELAAPFPIVNLGVCTFERDLERDPLPGGLLACCSAWGADRPIATQMNPALAWRGLFGSIAEADDAKNEAAPRALDSAKDDIRQVQAALPAEERQKLASYLDAFDAADKSQRLARRLGPDQTVTEQDDRFASKLESKQLEAQFDLAAAALVGGLTNVVTLCSGGCNPNGMFEGLGVEYDVHPIGHFQGRDGKTWQELYTLMRNYHLDLVARLARRLEETPEGNGSMLDNTVIVYTSDGAHTHHSDGSEWPFVLLGNLGGQLRGGRYLEYPRVGEPGNRTINALYCTLLHAVGSPREHFNLEGDTKGVDRKGPLEELLSA